MRDRQEWLRELDQRQQNIDPIKRIPNAALFQGTLIKGSRRLNAPQRIGAVIVGFSALMMSSFLLASFIRSSINSSSGLEIASAIAILPFAALGFYFGYRIVINALLNTPSRKR